jgi:hypothetical protein
MSAAAKWVHLAPAEGGRIVDRLSSALIICECLVAFAVDTSDEHGDEG